MSKVIDFTFIYFRNFGVCVSADLVILPGLMIDLRQDSFPGDPG